MLSKTKNPIVKFTLIGIKEKRLSHNETFNVSSYLNVTKCAKSVSNKVSQLKKDNYLVKVTATRSNGSVEVII